ncbi:unnamed protein product, partial [marine sediment metagenome]
PASFNLLDTKEALATISLVSGNQYDTHENLLYIRKDLIDKETKKRNKILCLIVWGERQYWPEDIHKIHRKDLFPIYQAHKNVYKKAYIL